jgi:hypothetical protein
MLIYLALLIPIITTIGFYLFFKHNYKWWEFFVPILGTLVIILLTKLIFDTSRVKFDEWWGSTVIVAYEQEPYNYWHSEMCSRQYACGTDKDGNTTYCTEYYDCSHQDDVGPSWYFVTNIGERVECTEKEYEHFKSYWRSKPTIVDENKNYDSDDRAVRSEGTKFEGKAVGTISYKYESKWHSNIWPLCDETRIPYTSKHTYINRVKASDLSVFNISVVSEEEADSMKLFKYPEGPSGNNGLYFPTILGGHPSNYVQQAYRKLNGKFGVSDSLRLWILVFPSGTPEVNASYQENYWVNGNKNEIVVCMALDKSNKVEWAHSFSWGKPTGITEACKTEVINTETFDESGWLRYYTWLDINLRKFDKREFTEEFSYVKIQPSKASIITIIIFAIIISIGANLWAIYNEIDDDDDNTENNFGYHFNKNYRF